MLRNLTDNASFVSRLQSKQRPVHREMSYRSADTFTAPVPTQAMACEANEKTARVEGWTPISDRPQYSDRQIAKEKRAEDNTVTPKAVVAEKPLAPAFPTDRAKRYNTFTWCVLDIITSAVKVTRTQVRRAIDAFKHPVYVGDAWSTVSALVGLPRLKSVRYTEWVSQNVTTQYA